MPNINVQFNPPLVNLAEAFAKVNFDKILKEVAETITFTVERYAKQVTPVDTGRLRSSIRVSGAIGSKGIKYNIEPNTNYAYWVHEGTTRMKGRPYMSWGVQFAKRQMTVGDVGSRIANDLRRQLSSLK